VRMRAAGVAHVSDLGCGIGGDALAFAAAGLDVHAVDADEVTAAIAAYNLAPFGDAVTVSHGTAEQHAPTIPGRLREHGTDLPEAPSGTASGLKDTTSAVWLDPARRTAGHAETRRTAASDWSPALDWCFALATRVSAGIKLGPGLDRDLIPDDLEAQWVSADGSVVELVLWSGVLARTGVRRAALAIRGDQAHELTAGADAEDEPVRELGAFLHEPDGAVIRARLIGDVARMLDAGMIDDRIAYLTGDYALTSPFVQSFRVRETMAAHPKAINAALRAHGIGRLEIKKRGMDVDPAAFRKRLTLRGDAEATLILTRTTAGRVAILADRV
ncbi:MAG: class I SAM-dependent methyltransferase, partial [Microbacterium sp.]